MRIEVITADWCGKCHQAKNKLRGYDIRWIDIDSEEGQEIIGDFGIEHVPTLILYHDDGTLEITRCVMCVKDVLDGKTEKIERDG